MEKEESAEEVREVAVPRAPDGGWGWMVVLGSFMCNAIVDGIIFSFGLLLPELAEDLHESKGKAAWVGSLLAGFYLIAGPLVSGLANTYGCRPVSIVGTFIAAISFALASQAPNIELLSLAFGVFGGIGFGFIYLPAVVTVGFYFERRRAFATGLAVCGSGVGTFVVAPCVQHLVSALGWRGTVLVLAGVVLNCALFGALFRPLSIRSDDKVSPSEEQSSFLQRIEFHKKSHETCRNGDVLSYAVPQVSVSLPEMSVMVQKVCSRVPSGEDGSPPPSYSDVVDADDEEKFAFLRPPAVDIKLQKRNSIHTVTEKKIRYDLRPDLARPFYRQDILYSASLLHLAEFQQSHNDLRVYAASVTKIPAEDIANEKQKGCLSPAMRDTFRQMLDTSLLKSPTFLLLGVGGFFTLAGFFVPFMFVVDRAVESGVGLEEAAYILPVIGLTNTVGRVFCGWISDRPSLNALTINNVALIVGGLVTILSPCLDSFGLLIAYGAVFGFCIGCFVTLRSIVIVDLLGLEKLTNAFGLLLLFQGIASIIGAPVAGMFYDATGSYDSSFYIAGTVILFSGLLSLPLPHLSRWEKRKSLPTPNIVISSENTDESNKVDVV